MVNGAAAFRKGSLARVVSKDELDIDVKIGKKVYTLPSRDFME